MPTRLTMVLILALLVSGVLGAQSVRAPDSELRRDLDRLARGELVAGLPGPDGVTEGPRTIAAGTLVRGAVVSRGPVDVSGTVDGTVVSLAGNVRVHRGGVVTGDAIAVGGQVLADSGRVAGEMRSMGALPTLFTSAATAAEPRSPMRATLDAAQLVAGVFAVILIIAIGVLLFAGPKLDEVVGTLERRFGRAFWMGILGQLLILPALAVLCLALALTIIGVLLIPFAIVAYAIAVAGLVTLGFLAVARLVGGALFPGNGATPRARALGGTAAGVAIFFALWMVAALLVSAPVASTVIRSAALAATWAAGTLGLGAAILSRAGTHRRVASGNRPMELAAWQTPTPITGVVAARRPVASSKEAV